jgi:hypothetical protein
MMSACYSSCRIVRPSISASTALRVMFPIGSWADSASVPRRASMSAGSRWSSVAKSAPTILNAIAPCMSSIVFVLRGGVASTTIAGRGRASSPAPEGVPVRLGRHTGGERRRHSLPCVSSTSPFHPFGRWQTGRILLVGSPDLGVHAPSLLPPKPNETTGDDRMQRSSPLFAAAQS